MREELKRIIGQLDEESLYLLYVAALEMIRHKPDESPGGPGTVHGGTIKGGNYEVQSF